MIITPGGSVRLLQLTDLTDNKNTHYFRSKAEQEKFFEQKIYREFDNYRYIRQESALQISGVYDDYVMCDYVMFRNTNFSGKWYYAFIESLEYISDSATLVRLKLDVIQTYMFECDFTFKNFIARANTRQELGGLPYITSLFPEQLEHGRDYVTCHTEFYNFINVSYIIASSVDLEADYGDINNPEMSTSTGGIFDKVPSALNYYYVRAGSSDSISKVLKALQKYPWIAQNIQSITIVPDKLLGVSPKSHTIELPGGVNLQQLDDGYESINTDILSITNVTRFLPNYINSKLYTYPYSFLEITSYNGQQLIVKPESLPGWNLTIELVNFFGSEPRIAICVRGCNSQNDNGFVVNNRVYSGDFLDSSIVIGDLPQCPVLIDNYIMYQANNANSFKLSNAINSYNKKEAVTMSAIEGGANLLSNLATLNLGGAIRSTYEATKSAYMSVKNSEISIRQQSAKIQDAEITPPSLAGQSGGDAMSIANDFFGVFVKFKTIRKEYADRLDEYFTRYGYQVNVIDSVQKYVDTNTEFNYIQTIGAQVGGLIPSEYKAEIQYILDNGITFWHNWRSGGVIGQYTNNAYLG